MLRSIARIMSVVIATALIFGNSAFAVAPTTVSPASLTFASTPVNTTAATVPTVTLTNSQATPLTITTINITGDFAVSGSTCPLSPNTLAAGAGCTISVSFTPTVTGSRGGMLTIAENAADTPRTIPLSGTGAGGSTSISPSGLSFGNVLQNTTTPAKLVTFKNATAAKLTINQTGMSGSGDFTNTATTCGATLDAGKSCTFSITFAPSAMGLRSGTLTITDSVDSNPVTVTFSGTGVGPTTVSPASLSSGTSVVNVPAALPKTVTLTNNNLANAIAISQISVTAGANDFAVSSTTCPANLNPGKNCTVTVTFTPTLTGARTGTLSISDSADLNPVTVALSGTGIVPTTLSPSLLSFGNVAVNSTSAIKTLTLKNNQAVSLNFTAPIGLPPGSPYAVDGSTTCQPGNSVAAGGSCTIALTFKPTSVTSFPQTLSIQHDASNSPQAVPLTGSGVLPLVLTPASTNFGNVVVNTTSATKLLTLKNNQSSGVSLTSDLFNGPFALDTGAVTTCPKAGGVLNGVLAGGASCFVGVTFHPTVTGPTAGGQITLSDSATNSPQTAALSGIGITATTIAPASLNFGSVVVNTTTAIKTITLTNNQTISLNFTAPLGLPAGSPYAVDGSTTCKPGNPVTASNSCTIALTFTPANAIAYPQVLTISHDAANSPQTVNVGGSGNAPVSLSAASLNFGTVVVGAPASKSLTLTNKQAAALTLSPITGFSGGYTLDTVNTTCLFAPSTLAGGASCVIAVSLNATATGAQPGSINIAYNAPGSPNIVNLSATAVMPVKVSPTSLSFAAQYEGTTSAAKFITLTNSQSVPLTISSATITGINSSDFGVTTSCPVSPATLPAGSICKLSVTFTPTASGTRTATLSIADDAVGSPLQTVALTGPGNAPVTLSPTSITNFSAPVGTTSAYKTITVKNNNKTALNISKFQFSGDFVQTSTSCGNGPLYTLAAGASCNVTVSFAPTIGGTRDGQLQVKDDSLTSPQVVNLSGTGTSPLTISPTYLNFSAQMVGTTSVAKVLTLTNHEIQSESFTLTPSGDFTASSNCTSGVVPAGASCLVYVNFVPSSIAPTSRTGSLAIAHTAAIGSPINLSLTGSATATNPPAAVAVVSPGAGVAGTTVDVVITGNGWTHFSSSSVISFVDTNSSTYPPDITVQSFTAVTPNQINATLVLGTPATDSGFGARNVTVKTGTETASLLSAFIIADPTNKHDITAVTPAFGKQGQTLNVNLTATGTHFVQGVTFANFGDGISVNSLTINLNGTDAVANITISNTTPIGYRTITLVTGGEFATSILSPQGHPIFQINPNDATLLSVSPNSGGQGLFTGPVTLTASGTHFLQNATKASIGGGVIVGDVIVLTPTSATAQVAVPLNASAGVQNVTVSTGGEIATLANAFTVLGTAPYLSSVSPASGAQGQANLDVAIKGVNTNFSSIAPASVIAEFTGVIDVNSVTVNSATDVVVNITVKQIAPVGGLTARLTSIDSLGQATIFPFTFTVTPSGARIVSVAPNSVPQGGQVTLAVVGSGTNWVQGTTSAAFYPAGVPVPGVDRVTINSATNSALDIAVPTNTPPGTYGFYMATGGEIVSSSIQVYPNTPSLTMSPANGLVPSNSAFSSLSVSFTGQFTHFSANTLPVIAGQGVTLSNFVVTPPLGATGTIHIAKGAATGPRLVTFTTGGEIVTTYFNVTSTPVRIISVAPWHGPQSTTMGVEIIGLNTNFTSVGLTPTQVIFGGPQITVNSVTVKSATDLIANITTTYTHNNIITPTPPGWQAVYVNTGAEQLIAGFLVDAPASPTIVSVDPPSAAQGSTWGVTITGSLTNWVQGVSELILGAGVTVADLQITSLTTATATIAVSPTAPVGGNSVIMITGSEYVSGTGFSVTPSAAEIVSVKPNFVCQDRPGVTLSPACTNGGGAPAGIPIVSQLQTSILNIVGVGTHWLQGETTVSFGPNVVVDQLAVSSPTIAQVQITVLSSSPVGFVPLTMNTDGETVTLQQAIDIEEGSPKLLAISPAAGPQGQTMTLQALGRFTGWQNGLTTAAFNNTDIKVNSVTVIDSETLTASITVSPWSNIDTGSPCSHVLTITTNTEQVSTAPPELNHFCVQPGAAQINSVSPLSGVQGSTLPVTITGSLTNFVPGVTTVDFGDPNFHVGQITVNSATSLTVPVGISTSATTGLKLVTVRTYGEIATQQYSFTVSPGVGTLNEAITNHAEQGAPLSGQPPLVVRLIGQYTHFSSLSTATFGAGIVVNSVTYVSNTEVDADITIDPLSYVASRTVTVTTPQVACSYLVATTNACQQGQTTGSEIVSANIFSVIPGPAIISRVSPSTANEGQEVVFNITGSATHWKQNFTQFNIAGGGYDLTINSVVINDPTSATVDMTISPTANPGPRSIYMVTAGESLANSGAFVVTGDVPAITYLSPNRAQTGTTGLPVTIHGIYTHWTQAATTVNFGPGVTVEAGLYTVDDDTHISAIINVDAYAQLGYKTVVVQTGAQVLTGNFLVQAPPPPPTPYISSESATTGIPGQTLTINFTGVNTEWDPDPVTGTQLTGFDNSITVNSFQVTSHTTARTNITISPTANASTSTLTFTTPNTADYGIEVDRGQFTVVVAQPHLTIVDPGSGMQGAQSLTVNILGQFTAFDATTTFDFGTGITVNGPPNILGPTIATQNISIDQLATQGYRSVVATTADAVGLQHTVSGAYFQVTPSLALISAITPNTAKQGDTVVVQVYGQNTHWNAGTTFSFGAGIVVSQTQVNGNIATLTLVIPALAPEGATGASAHTGGELANISNGFVVQPGTPLLLSSGPGSLPQQSTAIFTILSQATQWTAQNPPTVDFGPGIVVTDVLVTSSTSLTAKGYVLPTTAFNNWHTLTVTSGAQVLNLTYALYVTRGPAVINSVSPASGGQGSTFDVTFAGINTNWQQGTTVLTFPNVTVNFTPNYPNGLKVLSPTSAMANITVFSNAPAGQVNVTMTTAGEVASKSNAFEVIQTQPQMLSINAGSGAQGQTQTVTIAALYTHFATSNCAPNCTTANFGPGVRVNWVNALSATSLQANITVDPTAALGFRNVSITTGSESVSSDSQFKVNPGPGAIIKVLPNSGNQNQNGLSIAIQGNQTHFTQATPIVNLGSGVMVTNTTVTDDLNLTVIVNIAQGAAVQTNDVTVTTGSEVAKILGGFTVLAGTPAVTTVSPTTLNQGATNVALTVNGLYTHFNTGITGATFIPNDVTFVSAQPGASSTQAVINVSVNNAAQLVSHSITVSDPTDGTASGTGVFTVAAGIPVVTSLAPGSGTQGSSNSAVVINGNVFTHFSPASQVVFSGSGVTAGAAQFNSIQQLTVPVNVTQGTAPGLYTVTVTTPLIPAGTETAVGSNLFQVLPGAPTFAISPNVGNPGTNPIITITGTNTHFDPILANNTVTIASPNIAAAITGVSGQIITVQLTIAANATPGPYNVNVTDPTDPALSVTNGFTVQPAAPVAPTIVVAAPPNGAINVPTNTKFTFELSEPIQNVSTPNPPGTPTGNVILFDQSIGGANCNYGSPAAGAAAMVPGQVTTDGAGRVVTFAPNQNLKVGNAYILCVNGSVNNWGSPWGATKIQSQGASPLNLAYSYYTFTTGFGADTNGPSFTYSNIGNNDTTVGTNAVVTLGFNKAVDPTSVTSSSFYVQQAGNPVAGTIGYNTSFTQYTFTPSPTFSANTAYTVTYTNSITDWTDTPLANPSSFGFATGAGSNTTAPSIVNWTPCCTEVTGLNPTFAFTTSKPINPLSITPGTYIVHNQAAGWNVPGGTVSFASNNQTVILTLPSGYLLDSGTNYRWYVNGYDRDGNSFSASDYFLTDPPPTLAPDTTPPEVSQTNPLNGATNVVLNPQLQVQMNKFIDKTSLAGGTVTLTPPPLGIIGNCGSAAGNLVANCGFETGNTNNWIGSNFAASYNVVVASQANTGSHAMRMGNLNTQGSAVLSQTIADTPGVSYTFSFYLHSESSGTVKSFQAIWNNTTLLNFGPTLNSAFGWTQYAFTVTGTGSDTITFKAISDPGYFYIDDVAVTSVAPTGVITGATLASDLETVTFGGVVLATNTSYTATAAGLKDVDGNTMVPYSWSFATGVTSTQLVTAGTIAIAPTNANVVLTLSAPVDANTINSTTIHVFDNTVGGGNYALPGTIAISNGGRTITFTPAVPFANNHSICVYASYNATLYDIAGNPFGQNTECSAVTNAADTTAPTVLTITPADGSTGIGPNNPITVIFSKPMNPTSFNSGNVGLYTGTTLVTSSVSASRDTTAFTFNNSTLSYGTTYTVVLTPGVADLSGNHLAAQVASSFSTMAAPAIASPVEQTQVSCNLCITGFRPGSGATNVNPVNPVTFFISTPLNPSSVIVGTANTAGTMYVAQNGVLFDGSVTLSSNNQVVTFTPSGGSFTPGVVVSVYLTKGITDAFGNALTTYSASFTVAPATVNTVPVLTAIAPSNGSGSTFVNTVIDARFNEAIDPTTATSSNFFVLANNNQSTPVSGSVTLLNGNMLLRFTPTSPLAANTYYYVYLTSGLANATGQHFAGSNSSYNIYFYTGTSSNKTTPAVTAIEPTNGSSGIGVNALVRLSFNEGIEPATVDATTLTLSSNSNPIPYTFTYTSSDGNVGFSVDGPNQLVLTPQQPLPAGTPITVAVTNAVTDGAGNPATPFSATFNTGAAPDFTAPLVIGVSVASGASNVPVDSVFTITFNEAMDTRSFHYNSSIILRDNQFSTGQPSNSVPALMTFTPDGRQVTIAPLSVLAAGRQYYVGVCSAYDLTGNVSGCWAMQNVFTTSLTPPADLAVVRTTPPTGFGNVGTNIHPEIQFNHPVSELSAASNITLTQNGNPVPATLSFSSSDTVVTVTPNVILQPNAVYNLNIGGGSNGVTDAAAANRQYTPVAYLHTGISGASSSVPGTPLAGGAADTNWTVSGPALPSANPVVLSPARVNGSWQADDSNSQWISVQDSVTQPAAPFTFTTTFTVTNPATAMLNLTWGIDNTGTLALNGTPIAYGNNLVSLQNVNIGGSSGLLVNGVNTLTITMTSSDRSYDAVRLVGTVSQQSTTAPDSGTYLPSTVTATFTTGPSIDLTAPTITAINPINGGTTGTNPVLRIDFSEPVDPFHSSGWYLHNQVAGGGNIALTPTWAADLRSVSFSYATYVNSNGVAGRLDPNTNYSFGSGNYLDLVGNGPVNTSLTFTTGVGPVSSPPTAVAVTPPNGATGVPVNPVISVQMSQPIDPTSLSAAAITLNPSATGNVQLSSDGYTLTYALSGNLSQSTIYALNIGAGAFSDVNGNAVPLTNAPTSFTTAGTTLSGNGSISLASPAPNATNVSVGSAATPTVIQINLSRPVDPLSVSQSSFQVFRTNGNYPVSGTLAIGANGSILTFTPTGPLPANSAILVYASYNAALKDLAGNNFNCLCGAQFSTGNAASHVPQVISVTPADSSTGNGPNTVVSLVFNEALNQTYINAANFALFNGYSNLNATVGYSVDRKIVTLSCGSLPYGTQIMVLAGTGVQDLDGNHLAAPFASTFTIIPKPVIATPSVIQIRPAAGASGVDLNAPVTLYTSSPVNPATVNSTSVVVIENGIAVPGSFAVGTAPATSDGQTIVFTPTNPFTGNGLVQVFLTSAVTDDWGNAFTGYTAQFNTAQSTDPALTGPTLIGVSPSNGSSSNPSNSVVVATFDQAIASPVSTDNFYLQINNSGPHYGSSVNQIAPNMLELSAGTLSPNTTYYVHLTGIHNVNGRELNAGSSNYASYFYTGGTADSTAPVVNSVAPTNGATNVGGNAILEFTFNEVVDTYTINASTVTLTANGDPVPFTLSFGGNYNNSGTSVSLTPQIPLPDSASVTLKISVGGTILNLAGSAVPEVDVTFTTGPGPDFAAPYIVSESPNYNGPGPQQNYIQTNSTFVFVFNEPLSPNSVLNNPSVSLYNYGTSSYIPTGVSLSPDGTTVTFSPGPLTAGVQYRPCVSSVYDLAANLWSGSCAYFTAAADGSATPQVIYTTPINGATNVPTNGLIEIAFNELVSGRSLGQILLTPTSPAGAAMPVTASPVFDGTVVRITPASLLAPNTTYQLSIAGVTDFSGANAVTPQTIGFTTGTNPQIGNSSTSFTAANVMVYNGTSTMVNSTRPGVLNVDGTQPITLTFTGPVEEASLFGGNAIRLYTTLGGTSTSVPFTFALSNGGSTVAIVPTSALASGTEYTLTVNYNGTIYDQAGYTVVNGNYFYFTTH